jgi:hypothetical protein
MFEAYIQDVEFLGAFYRTHLSVPGIGAKTIMADIGCHEFVKLEASLGDKIYVRLLPERLRTFDAEKEKVEVSA